MYISSRLLNRYKESICRTVKELDPSLQEILTVKWVDFNPCKQIVMHSGSLLQWSSVTALAVVSDVHVGVQD